MNNNSPVAPTPISTWGKMRRNDTKRGCLISIDIKVRWKITHLKIILEWKISKEKYLSLIRQWGGALIIKLLGKSVNFKILDQRLRDLCQLEHGYELTDLEEDYYIVRFYSRDDYLCLCVLEGSLWIVMGHYLMEMKWRPKFRPAAETLLHTGLDSVS